MRKHFGLIFIVLLLLGGLSLTPSLGRAETAEELQQKINQQNAALQKLEAEIAAYQNQLKNLGYSKNSLTNEIKKLTLESQKLKADIAVSQNKIATTNLKIESLEDTIDKTNKMVSDLEDALAKNLREMNIEDRNRVGNILLSSTDFSSLWHYVGQQQAFSKGIQDKVKQLATTRQILAEHKDEVEADKKSLLAINSELLDQNKINLDTQARKNSLLKSTKNQETTYQKLVNQKIAAKEQMARDLADYESKLKYVLNPGNLPAPGSEALKWPIDKVTVTQPFGKTVAAKRLYTSGSHNGIDFGASTGTPVRAMASGTVVGVGNSDTSCPGASYGKWVFIKYDNGLASVYGHLSLIKTKTGASVGTGDIVAYVGASGYATGPHLHVSVFANDGVAINSFPSKSCSGKNITIPTAAANAYLDPMLYLPKK
ncbi:MAG: peptidoglycan DD-metalloendopeptidase family protein [Candidatus Pacebacteria bacterium]|nr:peptidoglycan DD-metalloendopeptidase family protein [Candidatus Paceibacterota bacterium]